MRHHHHLPSPDCAAFVPLLPLAAQHLLSEAEDANLRAHLAGCAHCRSELRIYDTVEEALRRSFAPRQGAWPPFSREELMQTLDHQSVHPIDHPTPAPQPKPRRFSEKWLAVPILLLVVTIPIIAGVLKYWGTPTTQQRPPTGLRLHGISMISPDEGWIVGDKPRSNPTKDASGNADQNAVEPIILHYKAGRWTQDQLPADLNPYHLDMTLSSIAMISATEGWATGSTLLPAYPNTIIDGITFPVLLHYTGGKWTLVKNPQVDMGGMVIRSATDGWAIGQGRALRYNGTTWTAIKDPAFASVVMQQVAEAPDGEVWITGIDTSQPGFDGDDPAAILHYDGKAWAREQINLGNDRLFGLTMVSAQEGWAVGYDPGRTLRHRTGPQQGIIVHYLNGIWQVQSTVASPPGDDFFYLSDVAMLSASDGWAVGQDGVMMHYHNGVWQQARSPTRANLSSVTFVSASEGWAIGDHSTILHYRSGAWSVFQG